MLVKGAKVVNSQSITRADILVEKDTIVEVKPGIKIPSDKVKIISAEGKYVFPGFIDLHTHLRVPGRPDKEDLLTGAKAAAKGGFTTIMCMPNTQPAIDDYEVAAWVRNKAEEIGIVDIIPIGAITKGRQGKSLTEFGRLKEAGCLALSDDGDSVENSYILRRAFEYAKMFGLLIISHCQDKELSGQGIIRESFVTAQMGFPEWPALAESLIVSRDVEIARYLGARLHLAHVSTKRSLEIIRQAKKEGVSVTCETCPHYFSLSLQDIVNSGFNPYYKVNPPLGTEEDLKAVRKALKEGVIDCVATDHAPHTYLDKEGDFYDAEFGMIGLEFAFSLFLKMVREEELGLEIIAEKMSSAPARILSLEKRGSVQKGYYADLAIVDLEKQWQANPENIFSKSKNTPFLYKKLKGVVEYTLFRGKIVHRAQS